MNIEELGWNVEYENEFQLLRKDSYLPARVIRVDKQLFNVSTGNKKYCSKLSGKFRFKAKVRSDYPSVGDWVVIKTIDEDRNEAIIYSLLKRKSKLSRKVAISGGRMVKDVMDRQIVLGGATDEQIIAANIDYIFIVIGLDGDYNPRRLERYLTTCWDSGANPVIILNKSDKCDNINEIVMEIESIAIGVPIQVISALNNIQLHDLDDYIKFGKTIALIGSSGVGKSTIINSLRENEDLRTKEVRKVDGKGRHTTTWRELIILPNGGIIIDNPGIRELQIWANEDDLDETFSDIETLSENCYFRNCSHIKEPGCAIREALENGELDEGRYNNYLYMKVEMDYLTSRRLTKDTVLAKKIIMKNKGMI